MENNNQNTNKRPPIGYILGIILVSAALIFGILKMVDTERNRRAMRLTYDAMSTTICPAGAYKPIEQSSTWYTLVCKNGDVANVYIERKNGKIYASYEMSKPIL